MLHLPTTQPQRESLNENRRRWIQWHCGCLQAARGQFAIAAANPERGIQISDYADLFYKFGRFTDEIDPVFDAKARKVLIAELKEKALILNPKYGTARHKTRCY